MVGYMWGGETLGGVRGVHGHMYGFPGHELGQSGPYHDTTKVSRLNISVDKRHSPFYTLPVQARSG